MQRPFYSVKKGCRTMEHSINSAQWYQLDELTATIYNTSFDHLFEVVLKGIKQLVPYSHSLTYLLRSEDGLNVSFNFKSDEIPPEHLRLYLDKYSRLDFINWYTGTCAAEVFRESDILPNDLRERSIFMKNWMEPIGLYHGAGMVIWCKGISYGSIFLYRPKDAEDFSGQELEVLRVINRHLCLRAHALYPNGLGQMFVQQGAGDGAVLSVTCLTKREREIIDCIRNHVLRSELCDKLFITENTLNKHFDNIYKKLNINSYEELLQLIKKR